MSALERPVSALERPVSALERRLASASLLVVAVLLGAVPGREAVAIATGAALVLAAAVGPRLALGIAWQRVLALAAAGGGLALGILGAPALTADGDGLARPWFVAATAALLVAATRLVARAPEGGAIATAVLGIVALTAAGEASWGPIYALAAGAHLALALLALRAGDRGRPPLKVLPLRTWVITLAVVGLAGVLGLALTRTLPPLSDWTSVQITLAADEATASTGFRDRLYLGALDGMLQSDEVVLRLDGARVDYLRGAVYDRYDRGGWGDAHPTAGRTVSPAPPAREGEDTVRATIAGGARDRYFLPLGASAIEPAEEGAAADRFGTLRLPPGSARAVRFERPSAARSAAAIAVAPPTLDDLQIPQRLRAPLAGIVATWTAGIDAPDQRIEAIARHLRDDFTYSLAVRRRQGDPLLAFLLEDRRGHCEYFASAMALLARAAGAPARVVTGYRVSEKAPLGDYWIVRERNAHAWTEVYLPGEGFRTVDATPRSELPDEPRALGFAGALADFAAAQWARAAAASASTQMAFAAVLAGVALAIVVRRTLRRRAAGPRERSRAAPDRPPPGLRSLLEALARKGISRSPDETLERLAARLDAAGEAGAAAILRRYAACRYGGVGELEPLLREMEGMARGL